MLMPSTNEKCAFEAILNFGESNSDTRGLYAAFPVQPLPNGMTYFKKPTCRPIDATQHYIDFLGNTSCSYHVSMNPRKGSTWFRTDISKPLWPYLQSIESDFRLGANFATSGSTVLLPNASVFASRTSPFSLAIQLNQMKQLKSRVDELYSIGNQDKTIFLHMTHSKKSITLSTLAKMTSPQTSQQLESVEFATSRFLNCKHNQG
ncbi:unnamed protein product [Fraxinus pennsylvanica]|uniref:Uncharacterized protein n=1 Tax=Fraxinus pennsylvanica TaxID=56036 RepID=A0AAD1Z8A6_9LAMI|nr:unnamed protein product [Fraxinus pennsylvanica]